jgi:AraC-like DNA-binding protein
MVIAEHFSTALVCAITDFLDPALNTTACAAFIEESRMKCENANELSQEIRVRPKTRPTPIASLAHGPPVLKNPFHAATLKKNICETWMMIVKTRQRSDGVSRSATTAGLRLGYFDQAHLVHDFRAITGYSPADYQRR